MATIVQVVVSVVLVGVTAWYVWLTSKISHANKVTAEAAQRSAEVSSKVLSEMREQRLNASQPLVVASVESCRLYDNVPESIHVELVNVGNGPALKVFPTFQLAGVRYESRGAIEAPIVVIQGGQDRIDGQFDASRDHLEPLRRQRGSRTLEGNLDITYEDIYGRHFEVITSIVFNSEGNSLSVRGLTINPPRD